MGTLHLQKCLQIPHVEVAGIFDTDLVTARRISEATGVSLFGQLPELLFESDAIIVSSSTPSHFQIAKQAFEAGVHVLLEKPVTETVAEAKILLNLARQNKLVYQVGFVERYRFAALTRGLDLSKILFLESHRLSSSLGRDQTVDVVSDIMIHDLDLALSCISETPLHLSAVGVPVLTPLFDLANVRLEFPSGVVADLNASRVSFRPERKMRIFSTSHYASIDFMANHANIYSRGKNGAIEHIKTEVSEIDALLEQARDFFENIRFARPPKISGEDGLRALHYTHLIQDRIEERAKRKELPQAEPALGPA